MSRTIAQVQEALTRKGFPCVADGVCGPKTLATIALYKKSIGLPAVPYLDDHTLYSLTGTRLSSLELPWLNEITKYMGSSEVRDNGILSRWLRSDKATLGDPAKLPWCGDAVQTAIKLTLPNEPFPGKVGVNPYYALNWMDFGVSSDIAFGAIAIFRRDGGGHVGFVVGFDRKLGRLRIRGGNQSNQVCDAWLDGSRLVGCRKPKTYGHALPPVPEMTSNGEILSTNEA